MIAYIKGKVLVKGQNHLIIQAGQLGYKVYAGITVLTEAQPGSERELFLHQHQKEDGAELYGFKSADEMAFFELLIGVSGVGPKSALGVMSVAGPDELSDAIARGDSGLLTKVSGIGAKTAERIILELREKAKKLATAAGRAGGPPAAGGEEIDALMALGYSLVQARDALRQVPVEVKDQGRRIKEALKFLGK